jgi:glucoamylase
LQQQIAEWEGWQARCSAAGAVQLHGPADLLEPIREQFATSAVVLRAHPDKTYPGAMVASLSVPWGDTGNERVGYHLVWPRDLVECAGALLAFGAESEAGDTLRYLIATQNEDGHWHQNQWLGGTTSWRGIQLDETAFPVLLAAALADRDRLRGIASRIWCAVPSGLSPVPGPPRRRTVGRRVRGSMRSPLRSRSPRQVFDIERDAVADGHHQDQRA